MIEVDPRSGTVFGGGLVGNPSAGCPFLSCRQRFCLLLFFCLWAKLAKGSVKRSLMEWPAEGCGQRSCIVSISTAHASQCGGAVVLDRHRRPVSRAADESALCCNRRPSGNAGLGFAPAGMVLLNSREFSRQTRLFSAASKKYVYPPIGGCAPALSSPLFMRG